MPDKLTRIVAPSKQTAFRLPPDTLRQLDEIARRLPRSATKVQASRTDAVIHAIAETHARTPTEPAPKPKS